MNEKCCARCNTTKPLTEFNRDKSRSDGHSRLCRTCDRERKRIYYHEKGGKEKETEWKEANRERVKLHTRRGHTKPETKAKQLEYTRHRRRMFPERYRVRQTVYSAVCKSKLPPASECFCFICGISRDQGALMEYHHIDYSRPLDIFPLCMSCHITWHKHNKVP